MLSVLSWNIRQGGGSRVREICGAIAEMEANIVILSEYKNNDRGATIRASLLAQGYRYQGVSDAASDVNSVLVVSKLPGDFILHPKSDDTYAANILEFRTAVFGVIGVYLPHKKKHKLLSYIQSYLEKSALPYIVAGDYNTGINGVDQEGSSFWYQPEMKAWSSIDYSDAYRYIKGDVSTYSWYSHQGNGFRYDHVYVADMILGIVANCDYVHKWREQNVSDHSPMIIELK